MHISSFLYLENSLLVIFWQIFSYELKSISMNTPFHKPLIGLFSKKPQLGPRLILDSVKSAVKYSEFGSYVGTIQWDLGYLECVRPLSRNFHYRGIFMATRRPKWWFYISKIKPPAAVGPPLSRNSTFFISFLKSS